LKKRKGAKIMKRVLILCFIVSLGSSAFAQKTTRTVTNSDLEKYKEKRVQSERDLRENYKRLGFPSPEELEKQNEQRRAAMEQLADELKIEQLQNQNDIVAQANALRAQIASLDAQINYLRSQGGNYSANQAVILSYGYGGGSYSPYRGGRPSLRQPQVLLAPQLPLNTQATQDIARMYPNSQDVYNRSIGRYAYQNQRPFFGVRGGRGRGFFRGGFVAPVVIGGGYDYAPNYLDQQLIFLEQQRAGLLAQWRLLEEQARRAGVKIN
jgi:hypothetical protein